MLTLPLMRRQAIGIEIIEVAASSKRERDETGKVGNMNCPKCDADIGDTFEPDDPSVGVNGGWYCDACDLAIGEHEHPYEPMEGDVGIMTAKEFRGDRPIGTPVSELSGQPGTPGYAEFRRIARSWGYD